MNYEDPILAKIRDKLENFGPKELKGKYYLGEPIIINKSQLPVCFIAYESHVIADDSSHSIEMRSTVAISVAVDLTASFNAGNKRSGSQMLLTNLICGRNSDFSMKKDCIVGVLRKMQDENQDDLIIDLGTDTFVEYGIGERGNNIFTDEAIIKVHVRTREFSN